MISHELRISYLIQVKRNPHTGYDHELSLYSPFKTRE
jgi:hypothetical protein